MLSCASADRTERLFAMIDEFSWSRFGFNALSPRLKTASLEFQMGQPVVRLCTWTVLLTRAVGDSGVSIFFALVKAFAVGRAAHKTTLLVNFMNESQTLKDF